MKVFKLLVLALIAVFTFGSAEAQIIVKTGSRHPHPRRVVVVKKRVYRHHRHIPAKHYRH